MINDVRIAQTATIADNVQLFGKVTVGAKSFIGPNCVIGYPWDNSKLMLCFLKAKRTESKHYQYKKCSTSTTSIGVEAWIDANSVICMGAKLKRRVWCDVGCFIGEETVVGESTWIHYGARIYNRVSIGRNCNIGGFICNEAVLGDNVTSFGSLIHRLDQGYIRGVSSEPSPIIEDNVFIGWGALIIGGIRIGKSARIGALSIITKDIKPKTRIPAGVKV